MQYKKLWIAMGLVMLISFTVLGTVGYKAINSGPPIPGKVISTDGRVLFTGETIRNGQNVWQSTGGQEVGTIWGHGAYVAPDWSADYLHRQSIIVLNRWARQAGAANYYALNPEQKAAYEARLTALTRRNTYDAATDSITLDDDRAAAFDELAAYYADIYGKGRNEYAIPAGALTDGTKQHELATFFFWTAWAAGTNRPGQSVSYTQNWPHEPLIATNPPALQSSGASSASFFCSPVLVAWCGILARRIVSPRTTLCRAVTRCSVCILRPRRKRR